MPCAAPGRPLLPRNRAWGAAALRAPPAAAASAPIGRQRGAARLWSRPIGWQRAVRRCPRGSQALSARSRAEAVVAGEGGGAGGRGPGPAGQGGGCGVGPRSWGAL